MKRVTVIFQMQPDDDPKKAVLLTRVIEQTDTDANLDYKIRSLTERAVETAKQLRQ